MAITCCGSTDTNISNFSAHTIKHKYFIHFDFLTKFQMKTKTVQYSTQSSPRVDNDFWSLYTVCLPRVYKVVSEWAVRVCTHWNIHHTLHCCLSTCGYHWSPFQLEKSWERVLEHLTDCWMNYRNRKRTSLVTNNYHDCLTSKKVFEHFIVCHVP